MTFYGSGGGCGQRSENADVSSYCVYCVSPGLCRCQVRNKRRRDCSGQIREILIIGLGCRGIKKRGVGILAAMLPTARGPSGWL